MVVGADDDDEDDDDGGGGRDVLDWGLGVVEGL